MKVIFLKDVARVGQKGSVKDISDGYALNFLIPNKLAETATPEKIKTHEAKQKIFAAEAAAKEAEWAKVIGQLNGAKVTIAARANETGRLYKQLSSDDVVVAIRKEKGIAVPKEAIDLEKPIRSTGEASVVVHLGNNKTTIIVMVVSE